MVNRRDVIISVLTMFCLTATLFLTRLPVSQSEVENNLQVGASDTRKPTVLYAANAMWIEPNQSACAIGNRFNVTVWLNITEDVFGCQVALLYNRTHLMCTRANHTSTGNYFEGHGVDIPSNSPRIDTSFLGNGSLLAYEGCLSLDFIAGPHSGTLIWAEFEVLTLGNSTLDLTTETSAGGYNNFVLGPELADISFTPHDGYVVTDTTPPLSIDHFISWKPTCPRPYLPSNYTRANEPTQVTMNISQTVYNLFSVLLHYRVDAGEWWNTTMTYNSTGQLWELTIPGQSNSTSTVEFFIDAYDHVGIVATSETFSYPIEHLPVGDLNGDFKVDGKDIATATLHFGEAIFP
jgi:hypothetical protein